MNKRSGLVWLEAFGVDAWRCVCTKFVSDRLSNQLKRLLHMSLNIHESGLLVAPIAVKKVDRHQLSAGAAVATHAAITRPFVGESVDREVATVEGFAQPSPTPLHRLRW